MKLADSVGHVRIATNAAWTLNTGYLVLFMQAGFALLTCGLVRKKNAAHLMMLNFAAYVFAFLAYYAVGYAFQFGAVAINAAPANIGGTPTLNHFLIGSGQWGFLGGKGFFLTGPAYDAGSNVADAVPGRLHGDGRLHHRRRDLRAHHVRAFLLCELFVGAHPVSDLRLLGLGRRLDVAARRRRWAWATATCDFAGSTVVHAVGGFCAMALAVILGSAPRQVRHGREAARVSRRTTSSSS